MSEPSGSPRSFPAVWLLLLLPVGLGLGWLVGRIPGEAPTAPASRVSAPRPTMDAAAVTAPPAAGTAPPAAEQPVAVESAPSGAPVSSAWTSYESALAECERTGKPILLDFNAEWCPPCQALKRQVFDDGRLGADVQLAVIPVSVVDRQREDGSNPPQVESLQRQWGVEAFPTLVVFHPRTGRKVVARGFGGAERTAQWIAEAAAYVK